MRYRLLALCVALAACGDKNAAPDYAPHQAIAIGDLRLEVLEDRRLTPAIRQAMWGGSKAPADFLAAPGVAADEALKHSIEADAIRHALVRLVDHAGAILDQRRLDCELAEIPEQPLPQQGGAVWAIGDDCSTGSGLYAGLITQFFTIAGGKLHWQRYADAATGEQNELTLVEAQRIRWHLVDKMAVGDILEVSHHPDFDDPRFKALKPGEAAPADLGTVTEYIRYRYAGGDLWQRLIRAERPGVWRGEDEFPAIERFPG